MIRDYEPVRILRHPRVRALGDAVIAVYLALLAHATPSGHVTDADVERQIALARGHASAVQALRNAGLLDEQPIGPGYWIVLPSVLDSAQLLPSVAEQVAADTRENVRRFGDRVGSVSAEEWSAGMDSIARERVGGTA